MAGAVSDEPVLRRVKVGDGSALYRLFMASIHGLAAQAYSEDQRWAWTSHITPARLEVRLIQTVSYVAEREGVPVGFAALDVHHAELDFLYVHPDLIRQGIGRRLAETIEWEAARHGIQDLELTASLNAIDAYERLGYRRVRDMTKTLDGVAVPCVRMTKRLPPPAG